MEDILALIGRAHQGDKEARDTLVEKNIGLVHSIVRRFLNRGVEAEDLFQIGSIGLLKAIDTFDTSYDVKFSTYAVPMITGEIKRLLRDDGMMKVSRSLKEICCRAYTAREELMMENGKEPEMDEIAERIAAVSYTHLDVYKRQVFLFLKGPKYQGKMTYKLNIPLVLAGVLAFAGTTKLALEKRVLSNYFGNIAFAYEDYGYPYCLATTLSLIHI